MSTDLFLVDEKESVIICVHPWLRSATPATTTTVDWRVRGNDDLGR
jgi:hypothetical protein